MTTPEQLAKWREEFERSLHKFAKNRSKCGLYEDHTVHSQWQGYLRRCQETEQAVKLAKFGADCIENAPLQIIAEVAQSHGLIFAGEFDWEIELNIEATIKELLK